MRFGLIAACAACAAVAAAVPTQPALIDERAAAPNCSAISNFYIKAQGGQSSGQYGKVDPDFIAFELNSTKGATEFHLDPTHKWLQPVGVDTLGTCYVGSFGSNFIVFSAPNVQRNIPIHCSLVPQSAQCVLQCQVQLKPRFLNTSFSWNSGGKTVAELATSNFTARKWQVPFTMLAIPAKST